MTAVVASLRELLPGGAVGQDTWLAIGWSIGISVIVPGARRGRDRIGPKGP